MSWSTYTSFALKGKPETLHSIKDFLLSLPVLYNDLSVHDLKELRKSLYGKKFKPENDREIGNGPGSVWYIEMKETGGQPVLHLCIETIKNIFEIRRFLKAMHRKFGTFNSTYLYDDMDFTGKRCYTTDRKGDIFPHFSILKGTKEDFKDFAEYWNYDIEGKTVPNTKELLKELRKEGISVGSFKELKEKYPRQVTEMEDGTAIAVYGINSPGQNVEPKCNCDSPQS